MHLIRQVFFLALLLAAAVSVRAAEFRTVRFGVCLSLTGELSEAGKKALAGVKLRMDDFNNNHMENGFRLEAVVRDDKSNPQVAAGIVRELATREKVPAIIGPLSTTLMLGMADVARELGVVLISPSVTSPKIGKNQDWCFRVLFDDRFQGVALARHTYETLGLKRAAAIINDRFAYAGSMFAAFKETFESLGGRIVAEEHYDWVADEDDMYDFTALLKRVAAATPETILLPVHSVEVAAIIRESLQAPIDARFCGGDTWLHENILVSSGNNLMDAYYVSAIDFKSDSPAIRHFYKLFDYSNDPYAQPSSIMGYDALSLLIKALENGASPAEIKEGMYRIRDFDIASGVITIDRARGSEKSAFIHRIFMENGEFVPRVVEEVKP